MSNIRQILENRILVIDGAMGTMIQRYALTEADFRNDDMTHISIDIQGNNDVLSITRPEVIGEIHKAYLDAGADIIETNTFSSNRISQADYGLEDWSYRLNVESAKIAKQEAEKATKLNPNKPRFVAGAVGPTNKTASMSPDVNDPGFREVSFDDLRSAYFEQVEGLFDGGADIILIETIFDTLNAKAALFATAEVFDKKGKELPIMISGTITDASGRTLSGQTAEAFLISVSHFDLLSVGLNCALGAEQLLPYLQVLAGKAEFFVSAYPNAGLPNAFGEYDQTPEIMQSLIKEYLELGLINIIGGCCGTTPDHIQKLAELASNYAPRSRSKEETYA